MHVRNLDRIVMRVRVDVGIHARLRLIRLQIVLVRLEHILDKTLHRICTIYLIVKPLPMTVRCDLYYSHRISFFELVENISF